MKYSTKFALLSYLPNIFSSILYLYLSANFLSDFPFTMVIVSMIIIFSISAFIVKRLSLNIDYAYDEFYLNGKLSDNAIKKLKNTQYNLIKRVPIIIILMIAHIYLLLLKNI